MAMKKSGLGKGLDALFSSSTFDEEPEEKSNNLEDVKSLKLTEIEPNKDQARKKFDDDSIQDLANSIKEYGIIQPIIVTKKGSYYEIIAGERRWRAAKKAGLTDIPAIIREDDKAKNQAISLIENIQREDLNPIEKARGMKQIIEDYGLTQQQLADKIGKERASVTNTLRILNLDERVIDLALDGKLSEGHCRSLLSVSDPDTQYQMALFMVETGASVREAEKKMKYKKTVSRKADKKLAPLFKDIENTFQGFFGTKVKLDAGPKKGKIVIQYNSNDELERILNLIK